MKDEKELIEMANCESMSPEARTNPRWAPARCDKFGDMPSGLHVTEVENAFLNVAELRVKAEAIREHGGEDAEADARDVEAEIDRLRGIKP